MRALPYASVLISLVKQLLYVMSRKRTCIVAKTILFWLLFGESRLVHEALERHEPNLRMLEATVAINVQLGFFFSTSSAFFFLLLLALKFWII